MRWSISRILIIQSIVSTLFIYLYFLFFPPNATTVISNYSLSVSGPRLKEMTALFMGHSKEKTASNDLCTYQVVWNLFLNRYCVFTSRAYSIAKYTLRWYKPAITQFFFFCSINYNINLIIVPINVDKFCPVPIPVPKRTTDSKLREWDAIRFPANRRVALRNSNLFLILHEVNNAPSYILMRSVKPLCHLLSRSWYTKHRFSVTAASRQFYTSGTSFLSR